MTDVTGSGDARRTMELLWGTSRPSGRGPRPKLHLDQIVATAIELADAGGLPALSMRSVAERLGAAPMALYTYVPSKAELLDIVVDRVHGELPLDITVPTPNGRDVTGHDDTVANRTGGGWRLACERFLRALWDLYERHPWMLQISCSRSPLGPNELASYEAQLRLLDDLGFTAVEQTRAVGMMTSFVRGAAKAVSDARALEQLTGQSDADWWAERQPLLDEMVGDWDARFPVLARLDADHAFDQVDRDPADTASYLEREELDAFEFGLQRLLDGLEAFVASRRRCAGSSSGTAPSPGAASELPRPGPSPGAASEPSG